MPKHCTYYDCENNDGEFCDRYSTLARSRKCPLEDAEMTVTIPPNEVKIEVGDYVIYKKDWLRENFESESALLKNDGKIVPFWEAVSEAKSNFAAISQ